MLGQHKLQLSIQASLLFYTTLCELFKFVLRDVTATVHSGYA